MGYEKGLIPGLPRGEEALLDAAKLGLRIKAARMIAEPPMVTAEELAAEMTAFGCETPTSRVYAWEAQPHPRAVPSLTSFLVLVAVTAPPGGLKFFAPVWPELWPLIERGLNGQSREGDLDVESPDALCPKCATALVDPASPYGYCRNCTRQETRKAKS